MLDAWPVAAVRAAEDAELARTRQGALMQRAAAALAAACAAELRRGSGGVTGRRVAVLAGAGNNGGDALFAAAALARRGARVDAVLLAAPERVHAAGMAALRAAGGSAVPSTRAERVLGLADLVIDGVVGLGGTPGLRPPAAAALVAVRPDARIVAVDLPSGVDPDTGELPEPDDEGRPRHVVADVTVTFGAPKPCLLLPPAALAAGRVIVVDLGLDLPGTAPLRRLEDADVAALWPRPAARAHKYSRGVLGVIAGSGSFPGAAVLVVGGAERAGATGMVRYLGPETPARAVLAAWPEVVPGDGRVQAWVAGPGLAVPDGPAADEQVEAVRRAFGSGLPVVADAGALPLLPHRCAPSVVLTPHAGELAALLTARGRTTRREQVEAAPWRHARLAAELTGATVLLKGPVTLVVDELGHGFSQADGDPALATAGSGDVLAGVLGALLAAGVEAAPAAAAAAFVHGRAGRAAARRGPVVASDVVAALPGVIAGLPA